MHPIEGHIQAVTRRHFFGRASLGLGAAALASLLPTRSGAAAPLADFPNFAPKAKRAIWLFMAGAPCQMDMLDYKPAMAEMYDKDLPDSIRQGQRLTTMTSGQDRFPIAPSIYKFQQHGRVGAWVAPHRSLTGGGYQNQGSKQRDENDLSAEAG